MADSTTGLPRLTRRRLIGGSAAAAALFGLQYGAGRYLMRLPRGGTAHGQGRALGVDRMVRTVCSPNCTGACGQNAWIRGERIVKIQQAADYPDHVYNPRGCMKGLSFIQSLYGPDRVRAPFIRAGARGEGKWRQVTWDEALDYIADKLKGIIAKYGADSVYFFPQLPGTGPIQKGAATRLAALLGASHGTFYDFNGDLALSMPITFGVQCSDHEAKDWANSRFVLVVGSNPVETRIPDAHFLSDAADNGARIVVLDPKYSATATKADDWLPIEAGTDGALALAMVNVILREGLGDLEHMAKYSDAPLLVRTDTRKRLRESDLKAGGSSAKFALWDEASGGPLVVGTDRLGLPEGARPALSGSYAVRLADGKAVTVRPGFDYVREAVAPYTPESVEKITQVPAAKTVKLARAFATTKPAAVIFGAGANHWYHSDLTGRAFALLSAVTGNVGRSGGGISVYVGQYKVRFDVSSWWFPDGKRPNFVPPMYMVHGPTPTMNPAIKPPKNGFRAMLVSHSNLLNQSPNLNKLFKRLNEEVELFVVIDFAMTPTAEHADVLLPAATWYEKTDLIATPLHPFLQLMQPAVPPQYESRPEVQIYRELAKRLKPELAKYYEVDEEQAIATILANGGPEVAGITLEQLKKGPVRLNVPDPEVTFHDQIQDLKPFPSRTYPFPLAATQRFVQTGRMEFYKEEDGFLELGEQVPVYKPPFEAEDAAAKRTEYPLVLLSPHERWRVHSTYSNQPWLLEINGGRAEVSIHPRDAESRHIQQGDLVEVRNDRGATQCWARVTEQVRPGTAQIYEGWWWNRYFRKGRGVNELTPDFINPTNEIYFLPNVWSPVTAWKEVLCDVRKV